MPSLIRLINNCFVRSSQFILPIIYLVWQEHIYNLHKLATCRSRLNVRKANKPKLTLMGFVQTTRQAQEEEREREGAKKVGSEATDSESKYTN